MLNEYMSAAEISDHKIKIYPSGTALLKEHRKKLFDFIFLDVEMPELDGFETAAQIRKLDLDVDIIFVTKMSDYIKHGYRYNAKEYLCKPVTAEDITALMDRLLEEQIRKQGGSRYAVRLKGTGAEIDLQLDDVIYFESSLHYVTAATTEQAFEFQGQLAQVEVDLGGKGFLRVHQSYLVNMNCIFAIVSNRVVFKENFIKLEIPLSRKYKDSAKKVFSEYRLR
jgi:DNA-binding LytR/AlgR family response regulator